MCSCFLPKTLVKTLVKSPPKDLVKNLAKHLGAECLTTGGEGYTGRMFVCFIWPLTGVAQVFEHVFPWRV